MVPYDPDFAVVSNTSNKPQNDVSNHLGPSSYLSIESIYLYEYTHIPTWTQPPLKVAYPRLPSPRLGSLARPSMCIDVYKPIFIEDISI